MVIIRDLSIADFQRLFQKEYVFLKIVNYFCLSKYFFRKKFSNSLLNFIFHFMKHFLSVFTALVMGLSAMAGEIVHTYHFGQPQFDQKAGYDVVRFNNTMMTNRAGEPLLPYHAIQLLLPAGEEAVAITVKKREK